MCPVLFLNGTVPLPMNCVCSVALCCIAVLSLCYAFLQIATILLGLLRGEEKTVGSCLYSLAKLISVYIICQQMQTQEL
jgi:hypothetical protein